MTNRDDLVSALPGDGVSSAAARLATLDRPGSLADLTVQSREVPHDAIVSEIMAALAAFLNAPGSPPQGAGA